MKKLLALMLVGAMTFSLAGCGNKAAETPAADTATTTQAASDEEAATEAAATDAAGQKYIIATDTTFAPFEFEDESGNMVGIDLDLLAAIAEDQGFTYELQSLGFSAAVTALEAGQCDGVIAGMSITDERQAKYDFSDPYFESGVGMGVAADSDIASYDDLAGKTVAAKVGTQGCTFAEAKAAEIGFTVTQFEDSASMYQDVLAGNSVACFEDYPVMGYEISRGMALKMPLDMEAGNSYGFATMKGAHPELVKMFNDGLTNLKASGKYDEIVNTYIAK
ncbi:MAG: transporter substrate-binding domain-containing protein [Lachnospiraceae bacterium]|nr:transporter substrate-binding domain-containing protein [Lachnospiraceae bacterium]